MVVAGVGWKMQGAEIGTKLRKEIRGEETEILGRANWGPEQRDR